MLLVVTVAVHPTGETRSKLTGIVERFRCNGAAEGIVVFGSHRKAEAAVVPYDIIEALLPQIEQLVLEARVRQRLAEDDGARFSTEEVAERFGVSID